LLAPYAAWLLAERTHTSGVLACVAGGLYVRRYFSAAVAPATRMQSLAVWNVLIFVLNGVVFALIGLQLGAIRASGIHVDLGTLALILATVVRQGLSLTPLIRFLELGEDRTLELEETRAREEAAQAAIAHLEQLSTTPWPRREDVERMRAIYTQRIRRSSPIDLGADGSAARAQAAFRRLRHETLSAERRALIALR